MAEERQRAVIGIDLGSADSYVGFIQKGTVEIVQNEVSQRKTPSLVGFTDRERLLGDQALSQIKSNVKNTCRNFKHLLGEKFNSPGAEAEQFWSTAPLVEDAGSGGVAFEVGYKGEAQRFTATAVTAMFLTKLKDITESWSTMLVEEAVIGVPSYFTDFQRVALLDAAKIAGIKVLRLMNEHTATALEYGYFRSTSFDNDKPHTVAFCQMGHTVFTVAVVRFVKGKLTILTERSAKVGGRDMDGCLMRVFAAEFKKKTGCDVLANKKALFKLEDAVTKTKKILSANSEASISCECLVEDYDFSSKIDRSDFLKMCQPMMDKVAHVLAGAIKSCDVAVKDIDAVEICGGASRVPWVKEMCSKAFGGKELSTTMNADECVARGCTIMAAMLSPSYKARDFKVEDTAPLPVSLAWTLPEAEKPERSAVVFPEHSVMNLTKVLTFFRKSSFELTASYGGGDEELPDSLPKRLGCYKVELPEQDERKTVKVRASLTLHGTFEIITAQLVEEDGEAGAAGEAGGKPSPDAKDATNGKGKEGDDEGDATPSLKRKASSGGPASRRCIRRTELTVTAAGCPGLSITDLERRKADEDRMVAETRDIEETNAKRNDLESYIFTMRSCIGAGDKYAPFLTDQVRTSFGESLTKMEDWLYDHPDETKQVFIDKLAELKVVGGPLDRRYRQQERRPEAAARLERRAKEVRRKASQGKPRNGDARSVEAACDAALKWLSEMTAKQKAVPSHEDPVLTVEAIEARIEDLQKSAVTNGLAEVSSDMDFAGASPLAESGGRTQTVEVD